MATNPHGLFYAGYSSASSRFINNVYNGIRVLAVFRKNGSGTASSTAYIAICRRSHGTELRVVDYNHVVQAAHKQVDLAARFSQAPTVAVYGLKPHGHASAPTPVKKVSATTLVGAIQKQADAEAAAVPPGNHLVPTYSLENLDVAGALAVMTKLVEASKKNADVRQLIKLIASSL